MRPAGAAEGCPAWLHVWVGGQAIAYAIDPHRSADRLEQVLGLEWSGLLVHDGWTSDDRFEEAVHQQCVAHGLVRAHDLEEQASGRAKEFPRQVIELFQFTSYWLRFYQCVPGLYLLHCRHTLDSSTK